MSAKPLDVYIDYKSPYAYLAIEPTWELERDYRVDLNWLPYTLDIPGYLGSAKVDEDGNVVEENRTPHQWRKVKYSYMDVRRYANLRGLTVRGPQKIWDSSTAAIGMLYAKGQGVFRPYTDIVYERFWRRELNIEDRDVIRSVLEEAGAGTADFFAYLDGDGRDAHDEIRAAAEATGIFGVPTYVLDGEVFWGREHLSLIRLRLHDAGLARPEAQAPIDVSLARR
jgi:2-hydroxychromene-2-carboxylate isomerase